MTGVRKRIVPIAAAVSLLLLAALGYALIKADRDARSDARGRFNDRAQISASLVEGTLVSFVPQLVADAERSFDGPTITNQDFYSADFTASAKEGDGSSAYVVDVASRRVIGSIGQSQRPLASKVKPIPSHIRAALKGEPLVSNLLGAGGSASIEIAVPFDSDYGERILVSRFPLELIAAFLGGPLRDVPDLGNGVLTVVDDNGVIVVDNDGQASAVAADPALIDVIGIETPTESDVSGVESVVVSVPMDGASWTLVSSVPASELYGEAGGLGTPLPWMIFISLLVASAGAIVLLRKVVRDSDRIDRANVDLARRNEEVERATKAKSEFLANMSHELRTPLNGIIGFSELLHDGKLGPITDDQREYLGDVLSSAEHLRELIESLLDLSKIEAGKMEFHPEPTDVSATADQVVGALSSLAARKDIDVTVVANPDLGLVVVDPGKLRQIFYNYISNAIKYTNDGGWVRVVTEPVGDDHFRIAVEDNGIGIRAEDVGRLFGEFEQLDAGVSKGSQGTGLGLALTKRIVEAQDGTVGVTSTFGEGSRFEATLPRVADAQVSEPTSSGHLVTSHG